MSKTINSYCNMLKPYIDVIDIDSCFSDYEKLDFLSDTLLTVNYINKAIPALNLKITNLRFIHYTKYKPIYSNSTDLNVFIKNLHQPLFLNLLEHYGSVIYYKLLDINDSSITSSLENLITKLVDIFLNREDFELETYSSITINNGTYLYYILRAKEVFKRAFKSYILYNINKDYTSSNPVDFREYEFNDFESDLCNLFSIILNNNIMQENNSIPIKNHNIVKDDVDNILSNEQRKLAKYKLNNIENTDFKDELILLLKENIETYSKDYETILKEYSIEDLTNEINDMNITDFKNNIDSLTIEDAFDLNEMLLSDIENLRATISLTESEIQFIKNEIAKGKRKKKDSALQELLNFLFHLSLEHNNKIRMQKALDYSDLACSTDYIKYSELKTTENKIDNHISNEKQKTKLESKLFKVSDIKKSIAKLYGVSLHDLENSINSMKQNNKSKINSNFVRLRMSNEPIKTSNTLDTEQPAKETSTKKSFIKNLLKKPEPNKSDVYLNALLKSKIKSRGLNGVKSSSKINSNELKLLSDNKKNLSKSTDYAITNLLEEADLALKEMIERKNNPDLDLEK